MAARNEQIGTVPCPFPGCKVECPLFQYRKRDDGRRSAFTGKFYAECIDHGRIDGASGRATQEYILDKGTVWGAKKPESTGTENPVIPGPKPENQPPPPLAAKPVPTPEKPAPKPEPKPNQQQAPKPAPWGFF